jgi:diguanylate cyclase
MRESDTVARLGGDEFAAILMSIVSDRDAISVIEKIVKSIAQPFNIGDRLINIGISIGYSFCPKHSNDSTTLLRFADMAMYQAKQSSKGFCQYAAGHDSTLEAISITTQDIRNAIRDDQLVVHYQPQLDLNSSEIVGAEALVRWIHPELGLVPPDRFIPLAERSSVIEDLTLCVLIKALQHWQNSRYGIAISVNLSARALHNETFVAKIIDQIKEAKIDPDKLCLEVTETAVMQSPELALNSLNTLSDAGIRLSIDDFGTGYSSLKYLKICPIDEIKIDGEFVTELTSQSVDGRIVEAIISLGHSFDIQIVAEGIETQTASDFLEDHGCQTGQGYFI